MSDYCIVVTDAVRARLFTLEPARIPELESGPKLREWKCLVNPEKELPEREVFSDTKSGRNRAPQGGSAHGYDDHRTQHQNELERRFAKQVTREACGMFRAAKSRYVILAAEPRMLGFLRDEFEAQFKAGGVEVRTASANLTKLSPAEIQSHLAKARLVPECRKPGA